MYDPIETLSWMLEEARAELAQDSAIDPARPTARPRAKSKATKAVEAARVEYSSRRSGISGTARGAAGLRGPADGRARAHRLIMGRRRLRPAPPLDQPASPNGQGAVRGSAPRSRRSATRRRPRRDRRCRCTGPRGRRAPPWSAWRPAPSAR